MHEYQKHSAIDLFADCGSLSLGLYQAGWEGLFAIEKNAFAFETLRYNFNDPQFRKQIYLRYCESRIMTIRECARIQSFPDWYEVMKKYTTGSKMRKAEVSRYSQIGNAIPPLFAKFAGKLILNYILK